MMEAAGGAWPPDERVHYERTVDTATQAMGLAAFDRGRAGGRALTLREAIDFARGTQPTW